MLYTMLLQQLHMCLLEARGAHRGLPAALGCHQYSRQGRGRPMREASTSCHVLSPTHQADCLQDLHYLASITLDSGKVFALFVKSPARVSLCPMYIQ